MYNGIKESGLLSLDPTSGKVGTKSFSNCLMQLRKICNHPYLFIQDLPEENLDWIYTSSGKFELLDRILPKLIKSGHKVLIFSQFVQLLELLSMSLHHRGIESLCLDGSMKQEDRNANVQTFSNPNSKQKVFLLSTRAGGHGLNL